MPLGTFLFLLKILEEIKMSKVDLEILEEHEEALTEDLKKLALQLTNTVETIKLVKADLKKRKQLTIIKSTK